MIQALGIVLINSVALYVTAYLVPGFQVDTWQSLLIAALVLGIINAFVKPVAQLITLPITFITLGLFSLVLNVLLLWVAAAVTPGFSIDGFITAAIGSIVLSLVTAFLGMLTNQ